MITNLMRVYIKSFFTDKIRLLIAAGCALLVVFHLYQFLKSGGNYHCVIRSCLYGSLLLCTVLFGKKGVFIDCILFAFVCTWVNEFVNFTGFFVALLSCKLMKRFEKILLVLYVMNVCICYMVTEQQISHLVIHLTTCALFYLFYFIANFKKRLNLTDDEKAILEELRAGKHQKEIDLFSKNIITKKLNEAKTRNNLHTTEELLAVFVAEQE